MHEYIYVFECVCLYLFVPVHVFVRGTYKYFRFIKYTSHSNLSIYLSIYLSLILDRSIYLSIHLFSHI